MISEEHLKHASDKDLIRLARFAGVEHPPCSCALPKADLLCWLCRRELLIDLFIMLL